MQLFRHLTQKELCRLILHTQDPNFDYKSAAIRLAKKADHNQQEFIKSANARIAELEDQLIKNQ